MITPFDFVRGYEDLHACRAAAIVSEKAMRQGIDIAGLRAEWDRRYPCGCVDGDPATRCPTELRLAHGLNVLELLGVLVRSPEPAVVVDSAALDRLAGNLAIMEHDRRPLPRARWAELPYVPTPLRPLQHALAQMHTAHPHGRPFFHRQGVWAFSAGVAAADRTLAPPAAGTER
jgi:hypothetical protein